MLSFEWSGYRVIKQGKSYLEGIQITHNGNPIDTLTVTKYAIWNSGNKMIEASDIVPSEPLRIHTNDEAKILSAKVTDVVNPSNMLTITENPEFDNAVVISFDYLSPNEGAVIQILHTGSTSHSLSFDYQIKGGKPLKKRTGIGNNKLFSKMNSFYSANSEAIYATTMLLFVMYFSVLLLFSDSCPLELKILLSILMIIYVIVWFPYIFYKYSMQVPKKLRIYSDYTK